jgi:hypothetical protein
MSTRFRGFLLAALQLAIVLSLGAKLLIDRARLPRVWARVTVYDPESPIRGRYLSLRLVVDATKVYGPPPSDPKSLKIPWIESRPVRLSVENGKLTADRTSGGTRLYVTRWSTRDGILAVLQEPVAFFIPEELPDPTRRPAGEELWVEVTVPEKGMPRPIQLGVKKNDVLTPLHVN